MRDKTFVKTLFTGGFFFFLFAVSGFSQPTAGQLADEIIQVNSDRLVGIERLIVTTEPEENGFIPGSTTRYVKTERNGYAFLEPVQSEQNTGVMDGLFDDQMVSVVREADLITEEDFGEYSVYKIVIDDPEKLNEFLDDSFELEDTHTELKRITIWLDKDEYIGRKVYFEQENEQGDEINIEILMDDYQIHSGLPIAHTVHFHMEGLADQFSEADKDEARKAMEEMENQLSQMPEAQRRMIEERLKPQMEQFRLMLESEDMGKMTFKVTDVQVNP